MAEETGKKKGFVRNDGGFKNPEEILNQIVSFNGLFEKIFWKLLVPLVYNADVENARHLLKNVHGYKDVWQLFPSKLERSDFNKLSKIVFRIMETKESNGG